jgi:hypothetical protein
MKISHEVPLSLLAASRDFNDYDYALVHLFEENAKYYDFYKESLDLGRTVILDNSVFELETAFDPDRFAFWINKLQPTEYIIPDVLDNANQTIQNVKDWVSNYDVPGKKIGVVQGSTFEEAIYCYNMIAPLVDKIAISFNCKFYETRYHNFYKDGDPIILDYDLHGAPITILTQYVTKQRHLLSEWMCGRVSFLQHLVELGYTKPVHLLGCSLPQEFKAYTGSEYSFIDSVDTSNPIVHAINDIKYLPDYGLTDKVSTKLIDYLYQDVAVSDDMMYNIEQFRSYCNEVQA